MIKLIALIMVIATAVYPRDQKISDSLNTQNVRITNATIVDTVPDSVAFLKDGNIVIVPFDTVIARIPAGELEVWHHGVDSGVIPGSINDSEFTSTIATFSDTAITITSVDVDTLIALNQTNRAWTALTVAVNGDVYAAVTNGYGDAGVYERSGGTGDFALLQAADLPWNGLASKSNGDVFAVIGFYDYCKQTGGTGTFDRQWSSEIGWQGMTSAPNGDVYATVPGTGANGDIYRFPGGAVPKEALSQTKRNWWGMCCDSAGNIYAAVNGGDIYMLPYGGSDFEALGQTSRLWTGICNAPNGDIYAATQVGGVFRRKAGSNNFIYIFGDTSVVWNDVVSDADGNIYACVLLGDIYKYYPYKNYYALNLINGGIRCDGLATFNSGVIMTGIENGSDDSALTMSNNGEIHLRGSSSFVPDSSIKASVADSASVFTRALTEDLMLWYGEKYPGDGLNINSCYDLGYNHSGYAGLSWMGDRFLMRPSSGSAGQIIFDYGNTAWVLRKHNDDSLIISYTDVADANDSSTTLQDTIALTITKTGINSCRVADSLGSPFYTTGTFTFYMIGVSGSVSNTANYEHIGNTVHIFLPQTLGTSVDQTLGIEGIPSDLRPTHTKYITCTEAIDFWDNGSSPASVPFIYAYVNTSGEIRIGGGTPPSPTFNIWTTGDTKGFNDIEFTYTTF
jgi:hypothetical protein